MTEAPETDPDADELHRIDQEIAGLAGLAEQYRAAWQATLAQLAMAKDRRQEIAWRRHAAAGAAARPASAGVHPRASERRKPETSTHTAQNILFALGGLLLGTAAIVFTAVAWATFGNVGRAAILAAFTALCLLIPLPARWRGLRATAETFAVLGLLLVVLDGYAAWYVNLFDVRQLPALRYAGVVCALTALVAGLYRLGTNLTGPGLVAVLAAAPALPLWAAPAGPTLTGWALLFATVAATYLIAVRPRVGIAVRAAAWCLHAVTLLVAAVLALGAELQAARPGPAALAGAALVAVGLVMSAGAALSPVTAYHAGAAAILVLILVTAGARFLAIAWSPYRVVGTAAVVAGTVLAVAVATRVVTAAVGPGPRIGSRIGSWIVTAGLLAGVGVAALFVAAESLYLAMPLWRASLSADARFGWQLLAAIGLGTLALLACVERRAHREATLVGGLTLASLALPGSVTHTWWTASAVDMLVATAFAIAAVRAGTEVRTRMLGSGSAVLVAHAVPASLARPESTAIVLGGLTLVATIVAALSRPAQADGPARRGVIGGLGLFVAMSTLAPAVGAGLISVEVGESWVARLTAGCVVVLVAAAVAVRRWWPGLIRYAYAATLISAVIWPAVAAVAAHESLGVYTAGALLAIAAAFATVSLRRSAEAGIATSAAIAAVPVSLLVAVDVLPAVLTVIALPYTWIDAVWLGDPVGVGLAPSGAIVDKPFVSGTHAVALGLVAVAVAVMAYTIRPRLRSIVAGLGVGGPTAILVGLTAAEAPWPVVPATTLLLGIMLTTSVAITPVGPWRSMIGAGQGLLYVGAGLAGSLTVQWSTVAGSAAIVVAGAAVGWLGVNTTVRLLGWAAAVAAGMGTATSAGLAAGLAARDTAFAVLATAAVWLAIGASMRRSVAESVLVQVGAHAGAVLALLLGAGTLAYAAAICTVWGALVALRALWPGTGRAGRLGNAATAAAWEVLAWWLLLMEWDVAIVEAYTLPLAGVVLLAGWATLRARPRLSSWIAYGPALAAAFLPSLATMLVLTAASTPVAETIWRRLLLGLGALAVVIGGAVRRRQAPVAVGGVVLAIVAIHETVLFWDLVPRWIPLALGGLLLLGLAMTYERRRRDLTRLRAAVGRMR